MFKLLYLVVVVSNILFWFVGCAILSLGVWMRFIEGPVKEYFLEYPQLKMALTIILACGVLFLVLSLVGTCGANMKNEVLLSLYTITMAILCTCEIISVFSFLLKNREDLLEQFADWYNRDVFLKLDHKSHPNVWIKNWKIVEHVQESLKCCGIKGSGDFQELGILDTKDAEKLRITCMETSQSKVGEIQRPNYFETGCHEALISEGDKYIVFIWVVSPIILVLQLVALISTIIFVIYLIKGGKYDDDDEDCSGSGLKYAKDIFGQK